MESKTTYIFVSHQQSGGQNRDIKITDKSFEIVTVFTYLGIKPMNTCFDGVHPDVWNVKDKKWVVVGQ